MMRTPLLFGVLCAASALCAGVPVRAQDGPETLVAPNGFQLFVEAQTLMETDPPGAPSSSSALGSDEDLRRQRLFAARNADALAKVRAALKAYIVLPAFDEEAPAESLSHLDALNATREFSSRLSQEATRRAAAGDAVGAAQSSLDALELSVQAARGPIINAQSGAGIAALARRSLLQNAQTLNAQQLGIVAAKWEKISGNFPTYAQTLRDEEQLEMRLMYRNNAVAVARWSDPVFMAQAEAEVKAARGNGELDDEEIKQTTESFAAIKGLTFSDINAELRAIFDEALARANQPYFVVQAAAPIRSTNPLTYFSAELVGAADTRLHAERNRLGNRALIAALRLRAAKLETGAYPETFDAPIDPFSPNLAPLVYKRVGESYVLYSVGPDGKDDNGAAIRTVITDRETGAKSVSEALRAESTGDIVAPVL